MSKDLTTIDDQLQIEKIGGKTKIVYNKAKITGSATQKDLMEMLVLAASMQAQKYVEKLSRGAPLDKDEIKSLTELAQLAKTNVVVVKDDTYTEIDSNTNTQALKANLYKALTEKLKEPKE